MGFDLPFLDPEEKLRGGEGGGDADHGVEGDGRQRKEVENPPRDGHGRVEDGAGNSPEKKDPRGHDHADGGAVEAVAGGALGGGHVEDHPGKGEGAEELGPGGTEGLGEGGFAACAAEMGDEEGGDHGAGDLGGEVGEDVGLGQFPAQPDGEGNGGIVVGAGDVAAGVDHDHEGQADDEGGVRGIGHRRIADGLNEEESPDEFGDEFVHGLS